MGKTIQIRNVPDRLHGELVRRARSRGKPLATYIQEILERVISRPPADEVFERIGKREPVSLGRPRRGDDRGRKSIAHVSIKKWGCSEDRIRWAKSLIDQTVVAVLSIAKVQLFQQATWVMPTLS